MASLRCSALALLLALASISDARADSLADEALHQCSKPRGKIAVSFKPDVSLRELVDWAMGFSCANFAISSAVSGRKLSVELITPSKLDRAGAWRLFLTALRSMGVTPVKKGAIYEIVEAAQAKGHALPVFAAGERPAGSERVVRALVTAEHLAIADLTVALNALKSTSGEVVSLGSADVVLVTDFASHLARMRQVLAAIDRPGRTADQVWVVPIKHADIEALATTLSAIVGAAPAASAPPKTGRRAARKAATPAAAPAAPTKILTDERTRSIILVASPTAYRRARALIRRLDIDIGERSDGHIHMIPLEHADAEETAKTLQTLLSGQSAAPAKGRSSKVASAPAITGEVRVVHDAPSNALLVRASMRDFLGISEIVRRLDTTRRQVYIEAMILEVSVGSERKLGGSFHFGGDRGDGGVWLTGFQPDELRSADPKTLGSATGLLGAVFGKPLLAEFLGQTVPSFGAMFQALATGRRANLLSSPRITTSDNTEAVFRVAESRRELGAIQTLGNSGTTQRSVETVDANLTLKVTPHVNATDQIRLEIELLIEEFLPSSGELGSDKTAREIKNTVVVRDQESIVLGGLMLDREVETETKIPLLGDIPLLGYLFKSTSKDIDKQNLVIVLTPYVLDGSADHSEVVRRNMTERAEFMRTHTGLEAVEYEPAVDYRRKRGLLEAINRSAKQIEAERAAIKQIEHEAAPQSEGPL